MREIFETDSKELLMAIDELARGLEARNGSPSEASVNSIVERSREVFIASVRAIGLYKPLSIEEFEEVYRGDS